jgi:hypothetical protein
LSQLGSAFKGAATRRFLETGDETLRLNWAALLKALQPDHLALFDTEEWMSQLGSAFKGAATVSSSTRKRSKVLVSIGQRF